MSEEKIIIRPVELRGSPGFEVWEDEQVRPVFERRRIAISYAIGRARDGARALEIHDGAGAVVRRLDGPAAAQLAHDVGLGLRE